MYGDVTSREQASLGLGDIVTRTAEASLKPFVTQITGPLIRVVGDRFPPIVKTAILSTLGSLLKKVPAMLKPFLPQLQRTFCKSLSEPLGTPAMRDQAARCLALLIPLQTRLDPLVVELVQGLTSPADMAIKKSIWEALNGLLRGIGSDRPISAASQASIQTLIFDALVKSGANDLILRSCASKSLSLFLAYVSTEEATAFVQSILAFNEINEWQTLHGQILALGATFKAQLQGFDNSDVIQLVLTAIQSEKVIKFDIGASK